MSKHIDQKIKAFNKELKSMTVRQASNRARKEVKELLKNNTLSSTRTYLTKYRKALSYDSLFVLNALRLSKADNKKIKRNGRVTVSKAQKNLTEIKDYKLMISTALELIDSDKYAKIAAGLCLLTGRRLTEILKTAKFTNSKNSQKVMYFKGQLKTDKIGFKYEMYALGNSRDKCKKALKRLRSILDTTKLSNDETSRKYNQVLNYRVRCSFGKFLGDCSSHCLRKAYATICTKEYKPTSQTTNSFLVQILGHERDDLDVANSYQKYYIEEK